MPAEAMTNLRDIPGKGKGLIATRKIPRGTRILSEESVITVPEGCTDSRSMRASIRRQVDKLNPDQLQAFLDMGNNYPDASQHYGIVRTNALPMDDESGIFLVACRINHACDNNAQRIWNESIKIHTVHVLRDIDEGEEITISYLQDVLNNRRTRQKALREKFNFDCTCHLCSLPFKLSVESDRRIDEILKLENRVAQNGINGIMRDPERMLRYVERQVELYSEHDTNDVGLPRAFFDAAQITAAHGDLARSYILTERAAAGWRLILGQDDHQFLKAQRLAMDPSRHATFGNSTRWKTDFDLDKVPWELGPADFEDWLWKSAKKSSSDGVGVFRNQSTFPSFLGLPSEFEIEHYFFEVTDVENSAHYQPRRHWCFLAEIVPSMQSVPCYMKVKDASGMIIPFNFIGEACGRKIAQSSLCVGYTVAVLYAEQHAVGLPESGINLKDPQHFRVFPLSMKNLLSLSDRVFEFSAETNGMKTCHGCGKQATSMIRCANCLFFWYCSGACQRFGWTEKDHKTECKLLNDGDLKGLLMLNESTFQGPVKFPLASWA
ncbi:hypothetical protein FPOAC2_10167 [Fusarium poae]|uniref:hypothetical protein n=1 Tax=Fusarium poae TaxID=36050 RepID=UPI001CE8347D|nr:hypothetical protein FPOAC1_007429 [Fusarium poae]KAG8668065.1 hypothetical protein FPOAC1_007429 [Fusarium poae]